MMRFRRREGYGVLPGLWPNFSWAAASRRGAVPPENTPYRFALSSSIITGPDGSAAGTHLDFYAQLRRSKPTASRVSARRSRACRRPARARGAVRRRVDVRRRARAGVGPITAVGVVAKALF